mgnify:CR=1 FL=1|jgi:hypothetical protein|tara:strand:- start:238 stop:522 length:285 start_codon:yes stop_codon:yes gene_type:complete
MSNRITVAMLENVINSINDISKTPRKTYTKDKNGKYKSNIGNYHLSCAYGGFQLHKIVNNGGGISTPLYTGYTTKKELYLVLRSFLTGLESKVA